MGKTNEVASGAVDEPRVLQPSKGGALRFIFNPETGAFMGRTARSWVLIVLFYTVYYGCLAAFFGGMLSVFLYSIIQFDRPHLTGEQSLLKMNPGMGYRPQPDPESGLISFTAGNNGSYARYVQQLTSLYEAYQKPIDSANLRDSCEPGAVDQDPNKVCPFAWDEQIPDCVPANAFGYALGKPCVLLKLNRVFGWVPDPANLTTPHPTVRCYGENAADAENLGNLTYQPRAENASEPAGYFSNVYFPFLKQHGFQSPLVAVVFQSLPANTLVMVECRLENLRGSYYSRMDREAMVRFDIFVQK